VNGFAILRPIIADASPENLKKATDFAKTILVYPPANAANPPKNKSVDLYGKIMEGTPVLDETIFSEINEIIREEVVEEQGMQSMIFDPCGNRSEQGDYLAVMKRNLENLKIEFR